jgi:hypothetical protein
VGGRNRERRCQVPNNCAAETSQLVVFIGVVSKALHAMSPRRELQIDYATWTVQLSHDNISIPPTVVESLYTAVD